MVTLVSLSHTISATLQVLNVIWTASTVPADLLDTRMTLVCLAVALAAVLYDPFWGVARTVITIVHEGGHALVAVLTGRRLEGIRLHSDTSGVTVSVGRSHGPGLALTRFAGYASPSLCGLGGAALISHGYATGVLWLFVLILIWMLTRIRNGYGLFALVVVTALTVILSWFADPVVRSMAACAVVWFWLIGAVRPLFELMYQRHRGGDVHSDADQLAEYGPPAGIWIVLWLVLALASLWYGASWITGGF